MDEILIDEKKYISSKRAAKITGYAKDYIGQLCREGRVPARLVGRSWYVLDSAIQDHRFGEQKKKEDEKPKKIEKVMMQSAWDTPRYESAEPNILPSIQKNENQEQDFSEASGHLEESWKDWFTHVSNANSEHISTDTQQDSLNKKEDEDTTGQYLPENEDIEVNIPIHTYKNPPEELLPRNVINSTENKDDAFKNQKTSFKKVSILFQFLGILLAIASIATATIGSGYFDSYFNSKDVQTYVNGVQVYIEK